MALNNDPNFPPLGPAPYFINREWCIGDSLTILNNNANNFDTRIENLNTLIGTLTAALNVAIAEAVPVGAVQSFVQSSPPTGWISCEGVIVPNGPGSVITSFGTINANFTNLFAAVSNKFGAAGQLPDLRGYFIRGHGTNADGTASTGNLGRKQSDALQGHRHSVTHNAQVGFQSNVFQGGNGANFTNATITIGDPTTDNTNGTPRTANETRPANIALLYCIKY
jgi:microcystin-dependent protein